MGRRIIMSACCRPAGSAASAPRSSPVMSLWKIFGGAAQEMDYSQLKGRCRMSIT